MIPPMTMTFAVSMYIMHDSSNVAGNAGPMICQIVEPPSNVKTSDVREVAPPSTKNAWLGLE